MLKQNLSFSSIFSESDIMTFTSGWCHILAFELSQVIENSQIVSILDYDLFIDSEVLTHSVVEINGFFVDITGIYKEIDSITEQYEDLGEQYLDKFENFEYIQKLGGKSNEKITNHAQKIALIIKKILENEKII